MRTLCPQNLSVNTTLSSQQTHRRSSISVLLSKFAKRKVTVPLPCSPLLLCRGDCYAGGGGGSHIPIYTQDLPHPQTQCHIQTHHQAPWDMLLLVLVSVLRRPPVSLPTFLYVLVDTDGLGARCRSPRADHRRHGSYRTKPDPATEAKRYESCRTLMLGLFLQVESALRRARGRLEVVIPTTISHHYFQAFPTLHCPDAVSTALMPPWTIPPERATVPPTPRRSGHQMTPRPLSARRLSTRTQPELSATTPL